MLLSHGKKNIKHSKCEGIQVKETLLNAIRESHIITGLCKKNPELSAIIGACVILSMSYSLFMFRYLKKIVIFWAAMN